MLPAGFDVNAGREPSGYVPNGAPGIGVPIKNTPRWKTASSSGGFLQYACQAAVPAGSDAVASGSASPYVTQPPSFSMASRQAARPSPTSFIVRSYERFA